MVAVSGETGVALDVEADAGWTGLGRAVVNGGGRCSSRLEAVEETRDSEKVLVDPHGGEANSCMGEGSGVRSLSPASWGDEKAEPGEREPALECTSASAWRMLGILRGKLAVDRLRWRYWSNPAACGLCRCCCCGGGCCCCCE